MIIAVTIALLLSLHVQHTEHAVIGQTGNLTKKDCSYTDGRFGRIDLSHVGLKHGIPAFRHVPSGDYLFS